MPYEYLTEGVYLEEEMLGRTAAASSATSEIGAQFNRRAGQGWQLMQFAMVDMVGNLQNSSERRDVAVAIYRRQKSADLPPGERPH